MPTLTCQIEDYDLPHCKRCGHHFDPACSGGSEVCDGCQVDSASNEAEAVTKAFGGNYEAAALYMGW
jgi:hypothetical protein